jgi:hypothetical protein
MNYNYSLGLTCRRTRSGSTGASCQGVRVCGRRHSNDGPVPRHGPRMPTQTGRRQNRRLSERSAPHRPDPDRQLNADGSAQRRPDADEAVESRQCSATQTGHRRNSQKNPTEQCMQTETAQPRHCSATQTGCRQTAPCQGNSQRRPDADRIIQPGPDPDRKKRELSSAASGSPDRRAACTRRRRPRPDRSRRSTRR